ncbi:MAG: hypothetical protein ACFBSE_26215 [Prochloraceae cyanobacterium]
MEAAQERKQQFVALLENLLDRCEGVKGKLAQKLNIKPSTLTPWLQGKIDPASLETLVFSRIAEISERTPDSLAQLLKIIEIDRKQTIPQEQFRILITQILSTQSRDKLSKHLGISQNTITNWLNPERNIDPGKIPIGSVAKLAIERGWTLQRLLIYLNLQHEDEIEEDVITLIQSKTKRLSLLNRVKLLSWLSADFQKELSNLNLAILTTLNNHLDENPLTIQGRSLSTQPPFRLLVIIDRDDITIASEYTGNLVQQLIAQPKNIKIGTIDRIPETLADTDLLIFDISTADSASISFIEDLEFNGEIIIFAEAAALTVIRDRLGDCVSSIFSKPFDWSTLKSQPFFQRID